MIDTRDSEIDVVEAPRQEHGSFVLVGRPGLYIAAVLAAVLVAGPYGLRKRGIFNCQASGYGSDRYLGYCGAKNYGDFDHGAMWFGLEPAATTAAANAHVVFLGSSRTVFGFSTKATADWFSSLPASYYLLGFTYYENYTFEGPLLRKLGSRAKVYVINIDTFFESSESPPAEAIMRDGSAMNQYKEKREWQWIHKAVCGDVSSLCGDSQALFRSPSTGAWVMTGNHFKSQPVSYSDEIDQKKLAIYTAAGNEFLPGLTADPACTILTIVPTVKTDLGTARAIAAALNRNLVAPTLSGLVTFDGSHLNPKSAQRWSAAFFKEAGPQIRKCLTQEPETYTAMSSAKSANR
jgi:hypothetical protein